VRLSASKLQEAAMRGGPRRASSNGQRQQFNNAQSDYQHGERHVIVIEPIPYKHGALPLTALLINVYLTAVSERFRATTVWFRGLWQKRGQHFVVCGGNPACVSQQ
jgi:hypothetical protein